MEGLTKEAIGYENGVLGGLVSALNAFANPGDSILVHSPTYIGFTGSITGAGYKIVLSELKQDEAGIWRMDYEDMDAKIKKNKIHVAVFAVLTIRQEESGREKNLKRQWKYIKIMIAL